MDGDERSGEAGPTLAELGRYVEELSFDDLPEDVVELEKRHVLDTLGCILYGTTTPWVRKVVKTLAATEPEGDASVLGAGPSLSPARAVLVNGTASHSMDYDDHCQDAGVHAGSATIPTALALTETADRIVTGAEFLTAVTAGVEVGVRSGFGIGYGSIRQGWHIAGWTGAFAGATTAGKLAGLTESELVHALAVAGTQGCGLLGAQYGAEVKRFHMGKAAEAGYLGAMLASNGFTGDDRIFQDRYGGIGRTMSDDYDVDAVTSGLGAEYRMLDKLSFKPFPSVGQIHAPVDATREILRTENVSPDEVRRVVVGTTETVREHVGWTYEPRDVMSAQSNIQYAIATLLVDGDVTVDGYERDAIGRPEILRRVEDVHVEVDDALDSETFGATVRVETDRGEYRNSISTPRGYPSNPMSDEQLLEKFRNQAGKVLDSDDVEAVIDLVFDVENLDDVSELVGVLEP
jgi:2-methylcitrate dehydratase PrpD